MLSETSLEHFDFHGWSNALIENVVNRVEYRHVHVVVTIDFLDTLRAVVSFGNHLHFELGGLDGITLSNHGAEYAVSGEVGIHGHEQVAQIDGVGDAPLAWLHALKEAVHFLHCICHQHGLEVVAQLESVADARCYGIDNFSTELYSMPSMSVLTEALTNFPASISAMSCAFSTLLHPAVR